MTPTATVTTQLTDWVAQHGVYAVFGLMAIVYALNWELVRSAVSLAAMAGAGLVVVTRGIKGALAWHKKAGSVEVEAPTVNVVDAIGAGDSFQAALLFALRAIRRIGAESLAHADSEELRRVLTFASDCAALTCGRAGAYPPRQGDVAAGR